MVFEKAVVRLAVGVGVNRAQSNPGLVLCFGVADVSHTQRLPSMPFSNM